MIGVVSLRSARTLSKVLTFPDECYFFDLVYFESSGGMKDGGGGRIRTFEVDDGRFTVCSLWPLGNPTTDFVVI